MVSESLVLEDKRLRYIAIAVIVAIGIAYMGWLVITYLEQRETGAYIRASLDEFLGEFRAKTVKAEVVNDDDPGND